MNKVIDLWDCGINDKVWSCRYGYVDVYKNNKHFGICVFLSSNKDDTRDKWFEINGKEKLEDPHPTLFHSFEEFCEYHGVEKIKSKKEIIKDRYADILNEAKAKKENEGG